MLNWDWVNNRPAVPPTPEAAFDPGWWSNAKHMLLPPLIDPSVPENKLAAWIDAHTMNVHHRLLSKLDKVRQGEQAGSFILQDKYWEQLQALPRS